MQFTPQETKLFVRLRNHERRWPRTRWLLLSTGVFAVFFYLYIIVAELITLFGRLNSTALTLYDVLHFAVLWPKCFLWFGIGGWFIVWAIRDWHGNANRMLLLRLVEAQQKADGAK
jgi:hypothetical protein